MIRFFKDFLKRIIYPLIGMSVANQRIDIYKTIIVNLRLYGFKGIRILPIFIYKNTQLYNLGKIIFQCPLKRGILTIGRLDIKSQGITKINNKGIIYIKNYVEIGGATIIDNVGEICLNGYNRISDGCQLFIRSKLIIGEQTDLGFHSVVMDSDDHFTINIETKKINNNTSPIKIGYGCWIGCNTFIKKGAILPDYTIVASANTLIAKDYSDIPPYSILGGIPGKVINTLQTRRIHVQEIEKELKIFFKKHPEKKLYQYDLNTDIDKICTQTNGNF